MMKVCDCVSHLTWINIRFTEDLFYVAASAIALVVVLVFAYLGCKGLFHYKKMIFPLKLLFLFASTASVCFTVLSVSTIGLCLASHKKEALIVGSISTFIYAFLFLCIWANLILRLYVAFRDSAFKMTNGQQLGYLAVFIFLVLTASATSVCQCVTC